VIVVCFETEHGAVGNVTPPPPLAPPPIEPAPALSAPDKTDFALPAPKLLQPV
jgi:hypothetical protein